MSSLVLEKTNEVSVSLVVRVWPIAKANPLSNVKPRFVSDSRFNYRKTS